MSYIMPKMFSSEFQSNSITIEDFKINPITPYNPISTKGVLKIQNLFLGMSYSMPKMLSSKTQSHSFKIEDFKSDHINPFNLISTKRGGG